MRYIPTTFRNEEEEKENVICLFKKTFFFLFLPLQLSAFFETLKPQLSRYVKNNFLKGKRIGIKIDMVLSRIMGIKFLDYTNFCTVVLTGYKWIILI